MRLIQNWLTTIWSCMERSAGGGMLGELVTVREMSVPHATPAIGRQA
jgi:hypothetical protein